jgi:hypothetical protein
MQGTTMKLKDGETFVIDPQKTSIGLNAGSNNEQQRFRKLVERRHPKFEELLPHWNFMEATYEGGREWFDSNVFRYIKEGDKEYSSRLERAYRFNHTREVVDLINKYLFKQSIVRNTDDAPDCLKRFWECATKSGLSIDNLSRQVSKRTSQYGRIGIVVDMAKAEIDEKVISRADEKKANLKAYAYIVGPQQLLDYSFDEEGELNWVLIHEIGRDDSDPFESDGSAIDRFRLWTKEAWKLFEIRKTGATKKSKIVLVDESQHDLGEVPVVLADNMIGEDEYHASALIDDIAYLDRAVANYLSNLDAIIQDQTFSQLAMPAQNVMPGEENYQKMVEMGTNRVFLYDGEGGAAPFYLSPDVKQADLIITAVNKIIGEIYHTVGLAGERTKQDNAVGIDNSSGVAKAYDFERVNALLCAKSDSLELVEQKIARLVLKWNGVTSQGKENLISYPDNFDTRGLYDEFDIAARLMLIDAPDEIRRRQMESVLDKLFPQLAKDVKSKMLKELKEWPVNIADVAIEANPQNKPNKTNAQAKDEPNGQTTKATKNNRQGQVTKDTNADK